MKEKAKSEELTEEEELLSPEEKLMLESSIEKSKREIEDIIIRAEKNNFEVIMTEKDFFKIKDFNFKKINYLKVELQIKEKRKFLERIIKTYENN